MNEEKELERFKKELSETYIDASFDRLLDLRNRVKNADSFEEIQTLMEREHQFLQTEFGLAKVEEEKSKKCEDKKADMP